jgi:hypothetical protein
MLPDFRFVLGGFLAIAVLGVAGLGLVTSVQLVREAHMAPLEDTRSLAFSGHTEWNQFYDPDAARRFEGSGSKAENPVAAARPQTPEATSPAIAHAGIPERTASIPAYRVESGVARDDKTAETAPPPMAETPTAITITAPPAEAAGVPVEAAGGPTSDASRPTEPEPPPAERVASAPATSPEPNLLQETQMPTQAPTLLPSQEPGPGQPQAAGAWSQQSAPPIPLARPKVHFRMRIARTRIRRTVPAAQQTVQNPGFPGPWPGLDNQFAGAPTTKKNTGKLTGTVADRPQ